VGIDLEQTIEKIIEHISHSDRDWLPVYRDNVNHVLGVLYLRDILKVLLSKTVITKDILQQFLHEPYYVPEGTSLNIQLDYFQQSSNKVAFIVDEYGEIQGLLTLNDILEEIVGDLSLSIAAVKRIQQQPDGSYLVDGAVTLREFNRGTEWELPLRGPRTMNGLIIEHLEAMPRTGTTVLIADYPIEIIQVKENRVKLARVFPRIKENT
jgi:Mg2+/Co2+ transporter CorB